MRELKINGIYKHFKGDYYIVCDIAKHADTCEEYVVYRGLYNGAPLWVRKKEDFLGEVDHEKYPNVEQRYRLEEQDIENVASKFKGK